MKRPAKGSVIVWHHAAELPYLAFVTDGGRIRIETMKGDGPAVVSGMAGWLPDGPGHDKRMFSLPPDHPDFDNVWAAHVAGMLDGKWHERMREFAKKYQGVQ